MIPAFLESKEMFLIGSPKALKSFEGLFAPTFEIREVEAGEEKDEKEEATELRALLLNVPVPLKGHGSTWCRIDLSLFRL